MAQTCCLKIYCPANKCLKAYQDILRQVDGVETVVFNLVNMNAIVSGNKISADALLKKLRESGKRANLCPIGQRKIQKMKLEQQKQVKLGGHKGLVGAIPLTSKLPPFWIWGFGTLCIVFVASLLFIFMPLSIKIEFLFLTMNRPSGFQKSLEECRQASFSPYSTVAFD